MNDLVLENLYEEVMDELHQAGTLLKYTEAQITEEVMTRFYGQPTQLEFYL